MSGFQHFIVATAGHVDHGKSALVEALTGTDPDRLPEEKSRGMTIDLGFAHLTLPVIGPPASAFLLGLVDVPGHEDFVTNMVAGVGSIDLALMVVAADDGWMPQTEEHLQILSYLGVTRAVVALTKVDLIQDEQRAAAAIREELRDTVFADAPIVPTSVVSGRGLEQLKASLTEVLATMPPPLDIGKPRLPVDRVFTLAGIGTVVTGTLIGGTLGRGQPVVIQPGGRTARIRSIQSHGLDVEVAGPSTRTALNLPDVRAAGDIRRGDVVTLATLGAPAECLDAHVYVSPRAKRPLKDGARVHAHHGSGDVAARVVFYDGETLAVGASGLAQLRLEAPAFVFAGDRFTLRDWAGQHTLAGGIVLDPDASRRRFRSKARQLFLARRATTPLDPLHFVGSQVSSDGAVRQSQLLVKSRFGEAEITAAVSHLAGSGVLFRAGEFVCDTAQWQTLRQRAIDAIDARHRAHPEDAGLPLTQLRAELKGALPLDELFDTLIDDLCRAEFVRAGAVVARAGHRPALPAHLQAAGDTLRARLKAKPFDPPSRKELACDAVSLRALRFLVESGEAVELSADVVIAAIDLKRATELTQAFIRARGPATVSDLRQMLGSSRRVVVPLLEHLDRAGVTLRQGDKRSLRSP